MTIFFCVLISLFFAVIAVKRGFYEMWGTLFNVVISIYSAVFLAPTVLKLSDGAETSEFLISVYLLSIAIVIFAILYFLCLTFLTGQFRITLPRIVDLIGSGLVGIAVGIIVWSFLGFLVLTMPVTYGRINRDTGIIHGLDEKAKPCLRVLCGVIDTMTFQKRAYTVDEILDGLAITRAKKNSSQPKENDDWSLD